jgi:hypothetical protein
MLNRKSSIDVVIIHIHTSHTYSLIHLQLIYGRRIMYVVMVVLVLVLTDVSDVDVRKIPGESALHH